MKPRTALVVSAATLALIAGATLIAAPTASADQIWYQGVARASADAPCPTTSRADKDAGWSEWTPSWAQWANGGAGGYVCTRAITWAHESSGGGGGICVLVNSNEGDEGSEEFSTYVLLPGWSIPGGTAVGLYGDAACTNFLGTGYAPANIVFSTDGESQAQERCQAAFAEDLADPQPPDIPPSLWVCGEFVEDSP